LCTVFVLLVGKTIAMDIEREDDMALVIAERDAALTELRKQGLTVRLHSSQSDAWHIADGGLYSGYVASGQELVELRRANKLNIRGIRELG
jgi:arginine decarboxylase-like protein